MNTIKAPAVLTAVLLAACAPQSGPPPSGVPTQAAMVASPVLPSPIPPTPGTAVTTSPAVDAERFPSASDYAWALVAAGFESPVDIQFPPDGSGRMFIVEQPGRIRIANTPGLAKAPFLDISDRVNSRGNEQGLLGLAFHPRYAENGLFYVNYTDDGSHNVIARFRVSADPDLGDAASETILVSVDDPFPNHNGGVLSFGPDGYLYTGMGDGGSANDPFGNGQNSDSLLGKILRLDVDGDEPYATPEDNPFAEGGGRPEVWAYGLRNPWRMSFDSATGDLYIGDVGQGVWEEVDFLPAGEPGGANFGWNYREGAHAFAGAPPAGAALIDPVAEYSHNEGGCSITGGYVYRGRMPEWSGIYLYGDYCSGKLWGLMRTPDLGAGAEWATQLLYETGANITTFGQDTGGEVYFADRSGAIYRLEALP
ncbi:MAG: PQQ-dependent sugar dehydrogenase [Chloroflexota bacterium]